MASASQLTSVAIGLPLPTIGSLDSALKKSLAGLDDFLPMRIHKKFGDDKNKWRVFPVGGDPDHRAAVALLHSVAKDLDTHTVGRCCPGVRSISTQCCWRSVLDESASDPAVSPLQGDDISQVWIILIDAALFLFIWQTDSFAA